MKIAGFYDESISNGLGWRAVLFVSGCPHHCPGCHNKEAQDFNYGEEFNEEEILKRIKENSILNGITISGGEPLCKENIPGVLKFIKDVKEIRPEFNVWCYSGYTLDQLIDRNDEETNKCLNEIDVLVDGRFVEEKKDPTLKFRGSSNQRILDLKPSLQTHKFIEYKL
ncbi:MAG: anaerobic ribonucleoside-triphosphate reductase activating protein [Clostridia bacterium]|jgi:anaerobic ribonucleoside-triphosphate reductase activating protein|nr:anaerobic ribonucleoside-triphosphate reductase activating protein [Clostridiaceae bacterium]